MTDNLRESISALMDDEASELEVRRLLKEMDNDNNIRSTWARYQLVRELMQQQPGNAQTLDISARVAAAIADDKIEVEKVPARLAGGKPLVSVAVAASVAFVVVFGSLQINQTSPVTPEQMPNLAHQPSALPGQPEAVNTADFAVLATADMGEPQELTPAQRRLRDLIDSHEQQADMLRARGVMPYAQLVSTEEKQD